jgi:RNA polymerase sigma-70 factor (ECF subfamily)
VKDECGGDADFPVPGKTGWVAARLARWRDSRDPEALGDLLKWQRHRAYAIALRILESGADAEDAVQQAFIKMLSRTHGFGDAEEFKVAVYRAVVQCSLNMLQSVRSRGKAETAMSQVRPNFSQSPQLSVENAEALQLVRSELNAMNPEDRALVVLCCQEGMSVSAASEVLSEKRETVRDRLARALTDLRSRLTKRGVSLSLLLLIGLLQKGASESAPAALCAALDKSIPGSSCSSIPGDMAAKHAAQKILAEAGLKAGISTTVKVAAALTLTIGLAFAGTQFIGTNAGTNADKSPAKSDKVVQRAEAVHGSAAPVADSSTNKLNPSQGISSPGGPVESVENRDVPQAMLPGVVAPGAKTEEQIKEESQMRNKFKALVAAGTLAAAMNSSWAGDGNPAPGAALGAQGGGFINNAGAPAPSSAADASAAAIKAAAQKAAAAAANSGSNERRPGSN